jgi:hypothetical protein
MWKALRSVGSVVITLVGVIFVLPWRAMDVLGRLLTLLDLPNTFASLISWAAVHPYIALDIGPWILIAGGICSLGLIHWQSLYSIWTMVTPRAKQSPASLVSSSATPIATQKDLSRRPLTLRQIFDTDFEPSYGKFFSNAEIALPHEDRGGRSSDTKKIVIGYQVMYDFAANSKFLSLYVPDSESSFEIVMTLPYTYQKLFDLADAVHVYAPDSGQSQPTSSRTMKFSHRLYIYMETDFTLQQMASLEEEFGRVGISVQFRGHAYWQLHMMEERVMRVPPNSVPPDSADQP